MQASKVWVASHVLARGGQSPASGESREQRGVERGKCGAFDGRGSEGGVSAIGRADDVPRWAAPSDGRILTSEIAEDGSRWAVDGSLPQDTERAPLPQGMGRRPAQSVRPRIIRAAAARPRISREGSKEDARLEGFRIKIVRVICL